MLKQAFIAIFFFTLSFSNAQNVWTKTNISTFRDAPEAERFILPEKYLAFDLDIDQIKHNLKSAPMEDLTRSDDQGLSVTIPLPSGKMMEFEVFDSPVMQSGLAAKYPSIKSYKGISKTSPGMNIRFDLGPYGFHGAIHSPEGIYYIDPYAKTTTTEYLVYDVQDHITQIDYEGSICGTVDKLGDLEFSHEMSSRGAGEIIPMRVYRLALACTGEWGAPRMTVENVLGDMVTGVNRMNQIYENELAMRVVLIDDNDKNIYFDKDTDPYANTAVGGAMLSQNTAVLNNNVGSGSYDIGHVYSINCDVGGIASLGSWCNFNKGAGVTCHYTPSLDFFASIVTTHEMGHQMSAAHTFNNCNGNESIGNGFEPGSGSTIMSYGGLCGDQNVVNRADDNYHVASLQQIYSHLRDGGIGDGCAEIIETDNEEPEITLPYVDGFSIPENVYFILRGEATDANNDNLTYSWEQFNAGPISPLGAPILNAPHFRVFPPRPENYRYFPSTDNVLSGSFDQTEVLFENDRDVNFYLVVRDNNADAGTAVWEELKFKVKSHPEQFEVTSQNNAQISTKVGDEMEVTWNVAGTDVAPINAQKMDILFNNTETASNFHLDDMIVLAKGVPNTGSFLVNVPNYITNKGRIIVKASDNIFFRLNNRNIQVKLPETPKVVLEIDKVYDDVCLPSNPTYEVMTAGFAGLDQPIALSITSGLPAGVTATFDPETVNPGESSTLSLDFTGSPVSEIANISIQGLVEDVDTFTKQLVLNVTDNHHDLLMPAQPENGASGVGVVPTFEWQASPNAASYTFELSASPNFEVLISQEAGIVGTSFQPTLVLDKNTVYYWRLRPLNSCGTGDNSPISAFATEALACSEFTTAEDVLPINITQSGTPTIEAPIEIEASGQLADVDINQFFGTHSRNKDLVVTLISPQGTEVELFRKICEQSNFNCRFDDASSVPVKCPLNNGTTYRPKEALSILNGEDIQGTWKLRIEDTKSGNGGSLNGFILQMCSNQVLDNPFIVKNNGLLLPPMNTRTIFNSSLRVDDNNNTAEELIYTVVEIPGRGTINNGSNLLVVGDQFSQVDIDNGLISYTSDNTNEFYQENFKFTVIDGEGGWIGITQYDITVDPVNSVIEKELAAEINVYPIPANDKITLDLTKSREDFSSYSIIDIHGKVVINNSISTEKIVSIDINMIPSGVYIINLKNEDYSLAKRIIVE